MEQPINILLVDDDARNLLVLETILDAPDYRLIKATNAEETLRALIEMDCAAIVMDVHMPDMNGIELAQLIKRRRKTSHIPILFLTAHHDDEENVMLGYDVGAVDYITKPVNPAILRSKIGVFVDLFRKTADLARLNAAMEAEIHDRKKAEEKFRLLVEAAPHAKIMIDQLGTISLVNSRTETVFGYTREELVGQSVEIIVPGGLPERTREEVAAEVPHRCELLGLRKDGSLVPLEVGFGQFQTAEGVFEIASLVDITRRKEAETELLAKNEELAQKNGELQRSADDRAQRLLAEAARAEAEAANSAKDRFLAMLSHELRTPLSPVLHAVALIDEEENCPPGVRSLVETIKRNVQLEARLIDDLLDLARIRSGKLQLNKEPADAHDLVRRAAQICGPEILKRGLSLELNLDATRRELQVDPARIQQIIWNLITNAVKYTPTGGTIILTTRDEPDGRNLRIEVEDSGIGIPPDRLGIIFDAFEQVHGERNVGLGLGLAISRVLAEMHGGSISARSEGAGKGSRFTVLLPAGSGTVPYNPGAPPAVATPAVPLRILLVEDHVDTATNLRRLLTRRGYEVTVAGSVKEAKEAMGAAAFDVLLSDIGLPDGQGLELMAPFVESSGDRKVTGIALSGYGMPEDIRRSREARVRSPPHQARDHRAIADRPGRSH